MNRPILGEIEALILTGKLKPRERLIEIELSSKLNASRFTVRKALQELTNHGLIETLPNKGARVIDLSEEEVEDIYLVRLDLEILASDLMVKRITSGELNRVKEIQKEYSEIGRIKNFEDMILMIRYTVQLRTDSCKKLLRR
jgi:DNA-binding GntR family transcriptional regulator